MESGNYGHSRPLLLMFFWVLRGFHLRPKWKKLKIIIIKGCLSPFYSLHLHLKKYRVQWLDGFHYFHFPFICPKTSFSSVLSSSSLRLKTIGILNNKENKLKKWGSMEVGWWDRRIKKEKISFLIFNAFIAEMKRNYFSFCVP